MVGGRVGGFDGLLADVLAAASAVADVAETKAAFRFGDRDPKLEMTVVRLPGDGGGLAANVNRWRDQLSLSPLGDSDLKQQIQPLDVAGGQAMLVDMKGIDAKTKQKARVLGVMVPQGEQAWFYKLMGDETVVEREKDAFTKFVQTVKYH